MADRTKIEWTEATWSPVTGCSKVSPGCSGCYAEAMARRFEKDWRPWTKPNAVHNVRLLPERLDQPLRWWRPRRVFVNSVSDLFHEQVPTGFIARVFGVMAVAAGKFAKTWIGHAGRAGPHTFQVLTKRAKRMASLLTDSSFRRQVADQAYRFACDRTPAGILHDDICNGRLWPLPNVHLGVSAEDQACADERIPLLLQTPAAVRFVSLEPMLGPIDLRPYLWPTCWHWDRNFDTPEEALAAGKFAERMPQGLVSANRKFLNWAIVGGENGPGARPMHPGWARSIRDQCLATAVPLFFKQWGEYRPASASEAEVYDPKDVGRFWRKDGKPTSECLIRVGKKAAGRELDGREWDEMPEVR